MVQKAKSKVAKRNTKRNSISRSAKAKTAAKKQAAKAKKAPARAKRKASTVDRRVADHGNKLVVLTRKNPHREGTARHEKFEAMRKAKTIGDYVASGQPRKYLRYAVEAGLAKIAS